MLVYARRRKNHQSQTLKINLSAVKKKNEKEKERKALSYYQSWGSWCRYTPVYPTGLMQPCVDKIIINEASAMGTCTTEDPSCRTPGRGWSASDYWRAFLIRKSWREKWLYTNQSDTKSMKLREIFGQWGFVADTRLITFLHGGCRYWFFPEFVQASSCDFIW